MLVHRYERESCDPVGVSDGKKAMGAVIVKEIVRGSGGHYRDEYLRELTSLGISDL